MAIAQEKPASSTRAWPSIDGAVGPVEAVGSIRTTMPAVPRATPGEGAPADALADQQGQGTSQSMAE
jgi:hypothetical protein